MNLIVISHRRSGTHLTIDSILNNFSLFNNCNSNLYFTLRLENPSEEIEQLPLLKNCIIKTHLLPNFEIYKLSEKHQKILYDFFQNSHKIYVYRNGLDVMVSLYFYLKTYNKTVKELSFSEFLRWKQDLEPIPNFTPPHLWKFHIESWLAHPLLKENTIFINYENFITDYHNIIENVADFLGQNLPEKIIDIRINNNIGRAKIAMLISEFIKKIKRIKGQKITSVLPRKGSINEYKKYFSKEDLDYFLEIAGSTMTKLGYNAIH